MFDTDPYQQVLGLNVSCNVTDVELEAESTEIHVHVGYTEDCCWTACSVAGNWLATITLPSGCGGIGTSAISTRSSMSVFHGPSAWSTECSKSRCRGQSPTAASHCSWSGS
jgi:hypothetical protein